MPLTPQQLADFQRLRQSYAPVVEAQRRKQKAQGNLERMHGLPPVKPQPKAGGGLTNPTNYQRIDEMLAGPEKQNTATKTIQNFGQRMIESALPLRKMIRTGAEPMLNDWYLKSVMADPEASLEHQNIASDDMHATLFHIKNALRNKLGLPRFPDNTEIKIDDMIPNSFPGKAPQRKADGGSADANLAQFLDGSHTPMRLYHSTTQSEGGKGQEALSKLKMSKEGSLGAGVYMTPSAAHSSGYSGSPNQEALDLLKSHPSSEPIAREFENIRRTGNLKPGQIGGYMMPLKAKVKNPLKITGEISKDPMVEALIRLGVDRMKAEKMVEKAYEKKGYIGKEVMTRALAKGHDALMQYRNGNLSEVVHYDPKMIKSATGNRGTYDTTKDDLSMAKGGSVEPKKTVKAYKLFRVHPDHPGKLFPLFVDANTPVEMNKWVDAKEGEMANGKVKSKIGALAYRPGWHAGDLPIATHIGEKSDPKLTAPDRRPANHAWAEVEMPDDVDWQSEATKRGTNAQGKVIPVKSHITDQIPKGGHYRYKTNPNMTGNWLIGGSMKVNKVLTDAEVKSINKAAGMADLPRAQPFKKKTFGFACGGCVGPQQWMAEEHVNYKAKGGVAHMAVGGADWKPHPENDLLQPIGSSKMVGDEKLVADDGAFKSGLSMFPSSKKSYRYVYHGEDQTPIGAMQIATQGPRSKKAVIQNLYVAEANRRQGIASKLLDRARKDFDVKHSTDLTAAGRAFAKAKKARGGRVTHAHHLEIEERPL